MQEGFLPTGHVIKKKHLPRINTEFHGNKNKQKQKTNTEGRISRSIATDLHGISRKEEHIFQSLKCKRRFLKEAKHFYREDAKYAKKQQASPDFLSSFALFASLR